MVKSKEETLEEAYNDIVYSTKPVKEALETLYEQAYANGFLSGNENAKEVAEYRERKKKYHTIEDDD